jgi:hypothetical protein
LWLALLALGGLLAGHMVSYFVVAPDAHERADLLAATGHSQHPTFATVALAALIAGVIGIVTHLVRGRFSQTVASVPRARIAVTLWALQTTGFAGLEMWERGHGLAGAAELLHEPAFLIGLAAQVVVALVAAAIVLLVSATVEAFLRLFLPPRNVSDAPPFTTVTACFPRTSVSRAAWNLRGPPSPASSPS